MYVGAGSLVGVTIILVGWVFCFCLFSVLLFGVSSLVFLESVALFIQARLGIRD